MSDLEKLLIEKNYDYHWDNDTIVVTYDGNVSLESLNKITTDIIFNNSGDVNLYFLNKITTNIEFNNKGDVNLYFLNKITTNIIFNNSGYVDLYSLKEITTNITFNNNGFVYLNSLKKITTNIEFNNKGNVSLYSLNEITTNVIFNNKGFVYLYSLKEINYFGKTYKIKVVDWYTMIVIGTPKVKNDITIVKTRFLKGNGLTNCPISYIAQKDNYSAHGLTLKESIEDLNFKLIKKVDLNEIVKEIKTTNKVTKNQYRLITGACN